MPIFPTLNSGAVCQFPTVFGSSVSVQILRFLDGSDQRFPLRTGVQRRWQIRLDLLTNSEGSKIEQFFVSQAGIFASFDFPDPISGALVPNCRFGNPVLERELTGLNTEALSLWVIETHE